MSASNVVNRVTVYLQHLISSKKLGKGEWEGCSNVEGFNTSSWRESPRKLITLVRWIPPDRDWIKLNTRGMWSQVAAGVGGTIRDSNSNLIRGFTARVIALSILDAELQALSRGLDIAKERGSRIWIELESMEVVSMFQTDKYGPANLRYCITSIRNKMRQIESKITQCKGVGNRAAAHLARQGCSEDSQQVFEHNTAPSMVKALIRMDQLNLPNFQPREPEILYSLSS